MKASNNLNQLISRVKSIFGRKAAPVATIIQTEAPPTDLSVVSAPRLKPAFAEVRKYLAERYGATASALTYKDYANGAMLVSNDETLGMALIILNTSEGLKNLPDNVMILGYVNSTNGSEWLIQELGDLFAHLKTICKQYRIQHLALAFSTEKPDHPATVQEADVTCIRLY